MHVLYWIVGIPIALLVLWFAFWAAIWTWWLASGHKSDHSGDGSLAILAMPFIPFVWAWEKLRSFFL